MSHNLIQWGKQLMIQVKVAKPKDSFYGIWGQGRPPSKHKNARVKIQNDIMYIHTIQTNICNSPFDTNVKCLVRFACLLAKNA